MRNRDAQAKDHTCQKLPTLLQKYYEVVNMMFEKKNLVEKVSFITQKCED